MRFRYSVQAMVAAIGPGDLHLKTLGPAAS
ncbi:hypothetical protein P3T40_002557 [Paraburkholderia sp. EB58]|jgi:hypothetical protein